MSSSEYSNLTPHRSSESVWDKRGWQGRTVEERLAPWLVSLGGAGLFAFGASRRSWRGVPFMGAGLSLVVCAASGICTQSQAARWWQVVFGRSEPDQVTTESMDSFPASDAPSSNATIGTGGDASHRPPTQPA